MSNLSRPELLQLAKAMKEIDRRKTEEKLFFYAPYAKQQEFHDLSLTKRERLLMAGNQNGKTYCGGNEVAYHLTGLYPDWWLGRRWDRPTRGWVAGVTGESTRDNPQRVLLGTQAEIDASGPGLGTIPRKCLDKTKMTLARGVSGLYDTVLVRHFKSQEDYEKGKSDGWSEMKFKSYERGREKWQGESLDWLWYDEEPPSDIYAEGLARTIATQGMVFVTFTPLQGMSDVVMRFINEPSPDREVTTMTIDDAVHIPVSERKKIIDGFLPHEREARTRGVPSLGAGKVFHALESDITCAPFEIPSYWSLLWGGDFGVNHPFAAVLLAIDRDTDTVYVTHCVRLSDALPVQHAAAMKPIYGGRGLEIPFAWPQDGWQRREFEGELKPLADIYRKQCGVRMLQHHATFSDGSNSTEAGIIGMQAAMATGHFKVFSTCSTWFEEYRLYHRKIEKNDTGGQASKINKVKDDLMSATRVGWMARRFAKPILYGTPGAQPGVKIAAGVDGGAWGS